MVEYAKGADISVWDWLLDGGNPITTKPIDFDLLASKCGFVYIRASSARKEVDKAFSLNWNGLKGKTLRGAYYNWVVGANPLDLADWFYTITPKDDLGELPPALDYEPNTPANPDDLYTLLYRMNELFRHPKGVVVYCNYNFWSMLKPLPSWMTGVEWIKKWVASWKELKDGARPTMPPGWDSWHFWQHTDRGPGAEYGVKSAAVDLNVFNGAPGELKTWSRYYTWPPEPPPPEPPPPEPPPPEPPDGPSLEELAETVERELDKLYSLIGLMRDDISRLYKRLDRLEEKLAGPGCLAGIINYLIRKE